MIVASNVGTKLTFRPKEKHAIQFSTEMQHFIHLVRENMSKIVNTIQLMATRIQKHFQIVQKLLIPRVSLLTVERKGKEGAEEVIPYIMAKC